MGGERVYAMNNIKPFLVLTLYNNIYVPHIKCLVNLQNYCDICSICE